MFWGALWLATELARAGVVVRLDDVKAERQVAPWLGRYESEDDRHHVSILFADGRLRLLQNVNEGQAWVTLEVPSDLLAEPFEDRDRNALLGRHSIQRSCVIDRSALVFTEFRTGWVKRLVRFVSLHLTFGGLELHREIVLEHRGWRGFDDWFEDPNEGHAMANRVSEHISLVRVSARAMDQAEFVASLPPSRATRSRAREITPSNVLEFRPHPKCPRNLEERP